MGGSDPSYIPTLPTTDDPKFQKKWNDFDGQWFEDQGKNLPDSNGHFRLESDTEVIVSFKGTIGKVKNIMINDNSQGTFVSSKETPEISDGSWIEIILKGEDEDGADDIVKIEWEGIIYDIPAYLDVTKDCPYAILATNHTRLRVDQCNISLNEEYLYRYLVADKTLNVYKVRDIDERVEVTDTILVTTSVLDISAADQNSYLVEYSDTSLTIASDNTVVYSFVKEDDANTYFCSVGPQSLNGQGDITLKQIITKSVINTIKREKFISSRYVTLEQLENTIQIFRNIKAQIKNLTLFYKDGTNINLNLRRIYSLAIPNYIKGPVIVTDEEGNSFELLSSYREVVDLDRYHIDLFSKNALEMKLTNHTTDLAYKPKVYGIHRGVTVNKEATDIDDFTIKDSGGRKYTEISDWTLEDGILTIPDAIKNDYPYFAIKYQKIDEYHYYFSIYERELFDGNEDTLKLSERMNESGADLYVYGIPGNDNFRKEYLLRVPATEDTIFYTSIDLCARTYDLISPLNYTIDTEDSVIYIDSELQDKYQYYIVDYLRYDSYTINEKYKTQKDFESKGNVQIADNYIVNIVSDKPAMYVHYEYDSTSKNSVAVKRTDITPNRNKFIILKRKEGYPYED